MNTVIIPAISHMSPFHDDSVGTALVILERGPRTGVYEFSLSSEGIEAFVRIWYSKSTGKDVFKCKLEDLQVEDHVIKELHRLASLNFTTYIICGTRYLETGRHEIVMSRTNVPMLVRKVKARKAETSTQK